MWIYKLLMIGLASTLIIELTIAIIHKASKSDLKIVALANILTNPLVVLCYYLLRGCVISEIFLIAILEISATAAEWQIYKNRTSIKHPAIFAVISNAISYGIGLVLF